MPCHRSPLQQKDFIQNSTIKAFDFIQTLHNNCSMKLNLINYFQGFIFNAVSREHEEKKSTIIISYR